MRPLVVLRLCRAEDVFNRTVNIKFVVDERLLALVSELQLVLQVVEAVVDRSSRKHEHLRFHSSANHLVHQTQVAVFTRVLIVLVGGYLATVAEIVALVDDNQIIIAPIQQRKVDTVAHALVAREVGVE